MRSLATGANRHETGRTACDAGREGGRRSLHDGDGVVVKDSRNVLAGELVGRVADEQTRFPDGAVTDNDTSVQFSFWPDRPQTESYTLNSSYHHDAGWTGLV